MIGASADSISLAASAQLQAAYRLLAADAEQLHTGPVFQIPSSTQAPFGLASEIDFSLPSSMTETVSDDFGVTAVVLPPQTDRWMAIVAAGQ